MPSRPALRLPIAVRLVFIFLCLLLATQPVLLAQRPPRAADQIAMPDQFLAAGDTYLTATATALGRGMALQQHLTALHATRDTQGYAALAEADLWAAQQTALDLAAQSATALGAITPLVTTIEDLGHGAPAALDLAALATAGLPAAVRANLQDPTLGPGLDQATIAALNTAFKQRLTLRHDLARSGLPAERQQALRDLGLDPAQVDQISAAVAAQGVAQPTLADRRAQFQATQADLATTRSQALITAVRLVTTAVLARQAQGHFSRAVTDAELAALADDELRLLLHLEQLQAAWHQNPTPAAGAGHWWFIQRHATRSAERLEQIILESHNLALLGDLLVVRHLATLPLIAQAGDAASAHADLEPLASLLAYLVQGRQPTAGASSPLAPVSKGAGLARPDAATVQASVDHLRTRLNAPLAQTTGHFTEADEDNNRVGLHLLVGLPNFGELAADVLEAAIDSVQSVSLEQVSAVFVAIVTGDTDNPALLVANILFSFIPVVGAIPDIYTLFVDPSLFIKALSIIGIVGSIGDLLVLLGVTAPLAGAAFLGDASVAVIKPLARNATEALEVLDRLQIRQAFGVAGDLIRLGVDELVALDRGLGSSRDEAVGVVQELFSGATRRWDNFGALAARAGSDLLLELGVNPGSLLAGRILRQGTELAPETMRAITNIGNDITDVGKLSDEAADGLARLTNSVGDEGRMRRVLDGTGCALKIGAVSPASDYSLLALFDADPVYAEGCSIVGILQEVYGWDDAAVDGWLKLTNQIVDDESLGRLLTRYNNDPDTLAAGLRVLNNVDISEWKNISEATVGRMCDFISKYQAEDYTRSLLGRMTSTEIDVKFDEQFRKILSRLDRDPDLRSMIDPGVSDEIRFGMIETVRKLDHPDMPFIFRHGWEFQIDRAKHYHNNGNGRLRAVEFREEINNQQVSYDFLLDDLATGDIVDAKYWQEATLVSQVKRDNLIRQIQKYASSGRSVTIEFASTKQNPVTPAALTAFEQDLINAGVPANQFQLVLIP